MSKEIREIGIDSENFEKTITINSKTGKVWIGDPCYALSDDVYDAMCCKDEHWNQGQLGNSGAEAFGLVHSTMFGDGCFNGYGVDSGTLSIINADYCCDGESLSLGQFFEIGEGTHTLTLVYESDGTFTFYVDEEVVEDVYTDDDPWLYDDEDDEFEENDEWDDKCWDG